MTIDNFFGTEAAVSHPGEGRFVRLPKMSMIETFAKEVRKAFRLSRREQQILNMLRDGKTSFSYRGSKMATVWNQTVRRATLDRLSLLGLITEADRNESGSDIEWIAVQPESVH